MGGKGKTLSTMFFCELHVFHIFTLMLRVKHFCGFMVWKCFIWRKVLFVGKKCFTLRKRGFIRKMNELMRGDEFYEGNLVLDIHKSLRWGSSPSKSQRNALSLFYLKKYSINIFIVKGNLVSVIGVKMNGGCLVNHIVNHCFLFILYLCTFENCI